MAVTNCDCPHGLKRHGLSRALRSQGVSLDGLEGFSRPALVLEALKETPPGLCVLQRGCPFLGWRPLLHRHRRRGLFRAPGPPFCLTAAHFKVPVTPGPTGPSSVASSLPSAPPQLPLPCGLLRPRCCGRGQGSLGGRHPADHQHPGSRRRRGPASAIRRAASLLRTHELSQK